MREVVIKACLFPDLSKGVQRQLVQYRIELAVEGATGYLIESAQDLFEEIGIYGTAVQIFVDVADNFQSIKLQVDPLVVEMDFVEKLLRKKKVYGRFRKFITEWKDYPLIDGWNMIGCVSTKTGKVKLKSHMEWDETFSTAEERAWEKLVREVVIPLLEEEVAGVMAKWLADAKKVLQERFNRSAVRRKIEEASTQEYFVNGERYNLYGLEREQR